MKPTVLHLAKWYPTKVEPLLGLFVRKHIMATKNEFDHTVISIYNTDIYEDDITRIVTDFEGIEEVLYYYKKKGVITKLKVLFRVWKEINSSRHDFIHAHIISWTSTLAYLQAILYKTPFFISEHWSGYHYKLFLKQNSFVKYCKRMSARNAKMVFPVSNSLKTDMLASGIKANYKIIGNVVDGKTTEQPKNELFTFVFVGDLEQSHKNVKGIIDAFSQLKNKSTLQLDIIGEGVDMGAYIEQTERLNLSNSIQFHGAKSNNEVFEYLTKSHVLVLNSNYETFSVICAEALLSGIPVIATKCGGPEAFLNEQTGILIDVGNTNQLLAAMKFIINNYNHYSLKDLKGIADQFNSKQIAKKLQKAYLTINPSDY